MLVELIAPLLSGLLLSPTVAHIEEKTAHETTRVAIACNCMAYARQYRSDLPDVNASDLTPTSATPTPGAIALMYYPQSGLWHVAYVEEVGSDWIRIVDANYSPCAVTRRTIHLPDRVKGYL